MEHNEAILIKVDKSTKKRMKEAKLNWSAEIRKFISERLDKNNERNLARAVAITDRLSRKIRNFNSTDVIRKMRDLRYGPDSN